MTDGPQGHGWWQASDLKWYPPEQRPDYMAALPPPPAADAIEQQPADTTSAATPTPQESQQPAQTRQVIPRDKLGALTKVGQGGQGVVYRAPNAKTKFAAAMVYKEYKTPNPSRDQLHRPGRHARPGRGITVLQPRPNDSSQWRPGRAPSSRTTATPTGFVMPAIPDDFFVPLTTAKGTCEHRRRIPAPTQPPIGTGRPRHRPSTDAQRYTLLREAASALAFLHKHGVCVGDISPKNLLFSLTPHEAIYFIDCDAMRINSISALPQMETPGWDIPTGRRTGHHLHRHLQTGPAGPAPDSPATKTPKTPRHLPANTPNPAPPNHHRHPH